MLSVVMGLAALGAAGVPVWGAVSSDQAIRAIADRLVAAQVIEGTQTGYWPGESQYTGSIVGGLAAAYRQQCVPAWRDAAVRGGAFITYATGGYFLRGEDAFAMVMLSEISADPQDNPYRRSLEAFYKKVRTRPGGTLRFVTDFKMRYEPSTAVLHMAYHTVAADYVNAKDRRLFRGVLLMYLALVNDEAASWPVMALGLATWALSETGPLDETPVVWWDGDWPVWGRRRLNDLSTLLRSHQLAEPGGYFYWRFDHTNGMWGWPGPAAGFTEDAVYALLGLAALQGRDMDADLEQAVARAREAIVQTVEITGDTPGAVRGHVIEDSPELHVYAGEVLMALCAASDGDEPNLEWAIGPEGLGVLAERWLSAGETLGSCRCGDWDGDGRVDMGDFLWLSQRWRSAGGGP